MKQPNIALVGNAPKEKYDLLNSMLAEEELTEICNVVLYGADGQPEKNALLDAISDSKQGKIQGIVCLPMKTNINSVITSITGKFLSNIKVTNHYRYTEINKDNNEITTEEIISYISNLSEVLKRDFDILNPRIALLSEKKKLDLSENSIDLKTLAPVVTELVNKGIQVFGPIDRNSLLNQHNYDSYDIIVSPYHNADFDIDIKFYNNDRISIFTNTEIPVATTDYDNILHAMYLVKDIARNRLAYDAPFANPLEKLYHEKKENGEKNRFTTKKKGFNPAEHRRENITYITERQENQSC